VSALATTLGSLLADLPAARASGRLDRRVRRIAYDSRRVRPGDLFVAVPGARADGARFAADAVARGARAVVAERDIDLPDDVSLVVVPDARRAMAALASALQGHPSHRLGLVGVTGTDGKTTTALLATAVLEAAGHVVGLHTTIEERIAGRRSANRSGRTTPEAPDVQAWLARCLTRGCDWAVLETSSHALALERVGGCAFDVAILTNLSPEHLDFHESFGAYRAAKARLFAELDRHPAKAVARFAVLNADDPSAEHFRRACRAPILTYGADRPADVRAFDLRLEPDRTAFRIATPSGERELETGLVGRFNVYNWLAAVALAIGQGIGWDAVERAASLAGAPRGRVQPVDLGQPFTVLVDFAHTPQALAAVLESARPLATGPPSATGPARPSPGSGRVIVVFGHAGERDQANRAPLGAAARAGADLAIVTTDDPYREDPEQIMAQVVAGATAAGGRVGRDVLVVPDRRRAIQLAIGLARPGDVVVIAGRGHERFQTVGGRRVPFDDVRVARAALSRLGHRRAPSIAPIPAPAADLRHAV
jgi:UDP-N-acetylmuramoyl-L-alanyl-D-glutamate--2,6-diaminopimelate ligase